MCLRVPIEAGDWFRLVRTTRSATIRPRARALGLFGNVPKMKSERLSFQSDSPHYTERFAMDVGRGCSRGRR